MTKKSTLTVFVTFRYEGEKLTAMFNRSYPSIKAAKAAIEADAKCFLDLHHDLTGGNHRQKRGWVKPSTYPYTEDYYAAQAKDGTRCFWQYFTKQI